MDSEPKSTVKITSLAEERDARKEDDAVPSDGNGVAAAATDTALSATVTDVASPVVADDVGDRAGVQESDSQPSQRSSSRTPFTDLSQVDADWALARTLQEQERAYMMLRMNNDGSDYGSWEAGSYLNDDDDEEEDFEDPDDDDEEDDNESDVEGGIGGTYDGTDIDDEDAFDVHATDHVGNNNAAHPDAFSSDEAFARALQEAEEREMTARMLALAGINDQEVEDGEEEDHHGNSQDNWEDVDPDELSYEELLALGEVVGTESRGLSTDTIASLASVSYKAGSSQHGTNDSCVICRLDYEDGETLTVLSCKHSYHHECINKWLQINKVCPVCSAEVSASRSS